MRTLTLLLTVLFAGAALAGCTGGDDDDADPTPATSTPDTTPSDPFVTPSATPPTGTTPATPAPTAPATPDSNSFRLETTGAPTQVKPGGGITFQLFANATSGLNVTSDHIGAHYANNDTSTPTAPGRKDCEHANGTLPGSWSVGCTFDTAGTWHVYGHAQTQGATDRVNYWAAPFVVRVRDYNLTATVPSQATYSTNFSFPINVTALGGSDNATSDHVGAHWFNDTTGASEAESAGTCFHLPGTTGIVGPHTITCNVPQDGGLPASTPKTVYVRAHVRVTEGTTTLSWWSQPYAVSVSSVTVPLPTFP